MSDDVQAPSLPATAAPWRPRHNPWAVALTVTLATFMEVLDTSIANVSLPHIAGNLSVTVDESTWVLTSYLVSNAIVLPLSGWLANRFGRKRFYMTCVVIFTLSSFLCGIAPSLGFLLLFRVLQGLGGGGLGPSEQSILADTFPPERRGAAFAVYGMAVVLAPAIGPTLGGWITDNFSWRWVFFINVPVGIISLLLSHRMVEDPPWVTAQKGAKRPVDWTGLALIAVGLTALELVLDKGQEDDWFGSTFITVSAAIAAAALVTFIVWEWNHSDPIVEVRLFKSRSFAAANMMMFTLGATLFGSTVLLPQFLQILMGYTAEQSGLALSLGGLTVLCILPLVGNLVSRIDPRYMVAFGFTVCGFALLYMAGHLNLDIDFWGAARLRVYQSVGLAFLFVPINTLTYVGVPPQKNNAVSGIVNLSRNMGGDVGIAFVTTYAARHAVLHQNRLVAHVPVTSVDAQVRLSALAASFVQRGASSVTAAERAVAALMGSVVRQAMQLAYLDAIRVFGLASFCMLPLVFLMRRPPKGQRAAGGH